ncbi:MAG TPA: hypothetical protein VFQ65_22965, partial [Kofleriaceae bacterium]|nr:hypothetical protein [Kofleriaceae bacterium]
MRASPTFLHSSKLAFDRAGKQLLVIEPDAIAVVDLEHSKTLRIEEPLARAVIGFDDQIWIATREDRLARYTPTGELIGTPAVLPFADPESFAPAPCGEPAALWGDVGFRVEDGHLVRTELVAEMTLPLAHRRQLTARSGKLVMPAGMTTALPAPLLGGAVLADGRNAMLLLDGRVRQLALVAIGTAQIGACMAAPAGSLRLANLSGHVLALPDPRTLVIVEPRGQREVATISLDREVRDFAVDPMGTRIVVRDTNGGVEILELRELIRWSAESAAPRPPQQPTAAIATSTVVAESVGGVCTWEPVHVTEVDDTTDERAIVVPSAALRALSPRAQVTPCERNVVLAQL